MSAPSRTTSPSTVSSSSSSFDDEASYSEEASEEVLLSDDTDNGSIERVVEMVLNNHKLRPYQVVFTLFNS